MPSNVSRIALKRSHAASANCFCPFDGLPGRVRRGLAGAVELAGEQLHAGVEDGQVQAGGAVDPADQGGGGDAAGDVGVDRLAVDDQFFACEAHGSRSSVPAVELLAEVQVVRGGDVCCARGVAVGAARDLEQPFLARADGDRAGLDALALARRLQALHEHAVGDALDERDGGEVAAALGPVAALDVVDLGVGDVGYPPGEVRVWLGDGAVECHDRGF
jgi:hypothetical protein